MKKTEVPGSRFKAMLEQLVNHPTWLKETMFLYLRDSIREYTEITRFNNISSKDSLFLYVPRITRNGQTYIESAHYSKDKFDKYLYNFLRVVKCQNNLVDIVQDTGLNLKQCCFYIIQCWEKNLILPTYSKNVYALVRLLSGSINIGDYLLRVGRISKEQYEWVAQMRKSGMMDTLEVDSDEEEIFVNLGYVTDQELRGIRDLLGLASQKTLLNDPNVQLMIKANEQEKLLVKLEEENKSLKEEKQELEMKVQGLASELDGRKHENVQYSKEIEVLKDELKKALKA